MPCMTESFCCSDNVSKLVFVMLQARGVGCYKSGATVGCWRSAVGQAGQDIGWLPVGQSLEPALSCTRRRTPPRPRCLRSGLRTPAGSF